LQRKVVSQVADQNDDSSSDTLLFAPAWKATKQTRAHQGKKKSSQKPIKDLHFGFTRSMRGMKTRRHREDTTERRDYSGTFVQAKP
jgi:hypothetical protein